MRKLPAQLDAETIREAKRLLDMGHTGAYVQRKLGLSRRTVYRIFEGTIQADAEEGTHVRCKGCGGLQVLPCLVCMTRSQIAA